MRLANLALARHQGGRPAGRAPVVRAFAWIRLQGEQVSRDKRNRAGARAAGAARNRAANPGRDSVLTDGEGPGAAGTRSSSDLHLEVRDSAGDRQHLLDVALGARGRGRLERPEKAHAVDGGSVRGGQARDEHRGRAFRTFFARWTFVAQQTLFASRTFFALRAFFASRTFGPFGTSWSFVTSETFGPFGTSRSFVTSETFGPFGTSWSFITSETFGPFGTSRSFITGCAFVPGQTLGTFVPN